MLPQALVIPNESNDLSQPSLFQFARALAILREAGIEPRIVEYLKTPLTHDELKTLIARMGVPARDVIRWKEKAASNLNNDAPDDDLLDALAANPVLLNRPIVATDKGAKLCRPPELVRELL